MTPRGKKQQKRIIQKSKERLATRPLNWGGDNFSFVGWLTELTLSCSKGRKVKKYA